VPPKIRELIAELEQAGFVNQGGKGSHRVFRHPVASKRVTLSGTPGDDAKQYQVREVRGAIKDLKR
jgi:predicted RNA binding protein YcfA (HicA-like mRNA interferase family)